MPEWWALSSNKRTKIPFEAPKTKIIELLQLFKNSHKVAWVPLYACLLSIQIIFLSKEASKFTSFNSIHFLLGYYQTKAIVNMISCIIHFHFLFIKKKEKSFGWMASHEKYFHLFLLSRHERKFSEVSFNEININSVYINSEKSWKEF